MSESAHFFGLYGNFALRKKRQNFRLRNVNVNLFYSGTSSPLGLYFVLIEITFRERKLCSYISDKILSNKSVASTLATLEIELNIQFNKI